MATVEVWLVNLFGAAAWVGGGYLGIYHVLPRVKEMLEDVFKYSKAVNALVALLTIWVYVAVVGGVIQKLTEIGEKYLSYVTVVQPALDLLNSFIPYVTWFVIGIGLVVIAERIKFNNKIPKSPNL